MNPYSLVLDDAPTWRRFAVRLEVDGDGYPAGAAEVLTRQGAFRISPAQHGLVFQADVTAPNAIYAAHRLRDTLASWARVYDPDFTLGAVRSVAAAVRL